MATPIRVKRGTKSQLDTAAGSNGLAAGEPYLVTDQGGRLAVGTGTSAYVMAQKRGLSCFCSGKPADSEVIGAGVAPYAFTLVQANCKAQALTAFTSAKTFTIKKNGTQIGTISFAAGATLGTVSITSAAIAVGDYVTVHGPASADSTGADISVLLVEA